MKRIMSMALVVMLFAISLTGWGGSYDAPSSLNDSIASKEVSEYKVLKVQIFPTPYDFDPATYYYRESQDVINNVFEGLYRYIDGALVPGIAQRYEVSEDGLVYTFYLRDAMWDDGQILTAYDFEYAWKRAIKPESEGHFTFKFDAIKNAKAYAMGDATSDEVGIKVLDLKTLQVTLEEPTPYFMQLVSSCSYMPVRKDVVEQNPEGWTGGHGESLVGNGPFKLVYNDDNVLILMRNPNYWNHKSVPLDFIQMFKISNSYAAYELFNKERVRSDNRSTL